MTDRNLAKTISHWNSQPWHSDELIFWSQLPRVQRRLALKESGQADGNWIDYTLDTYLQDKLPLNDCLSLGCGRGRIERLWAERQAFKTCDAFDISPKAIDQAREQAKKAGFNNIQYAVSDINHIELPVHQYDTAWAVSSAHHFMNLDHVFFQVSRALKPEGIFILHEYIGANHFQFADRQRQVIEACFNLLPDQYRLLPAAEKDAIVSPSLSDTTQDYRRLISRTADMIRDGSFLSTMGRYWRRRKAIRGGNRPVKETTFPTLNAVISVDPSEAVRSAEIIPILKTYFDIVEFRPLGGSILQFLLANIAMNFQDETGEKFLEIFIDLEDTLMECGDLESDFAFIICRPLAK
jgi:ubiquinone/menaquinone biosynthesis C-methylase UbiE